MAGINGIYTLSAGELKKAFAAAKETGADFLVVHSRSEASLMGGNEMSEGTVAVRAGHQLQDMLKADTGKGNFVVKAVYDLKQDFSGLKGKETTALLDQGALRAITADEARRRAFKYHQSLPWHSRLFRKAPEKPRYLSLNA